MNRRELWETARAGLVIGAALGIVRGVGAILAARHTARVLDAVTSGMTDVVRVAAETYSAAPTPTDFAAVHQAARAATAEGATGLGAALWAVGRKIADDVEPVGERIADAIECAEDAMRARHERGTR